MPSDTGRAHSGGSGSCLLPRPAALTFASSGPGRDTWGPIPRLFMHHAPTVPHEPILWSDANPFKQPVPPGHWPIRHVNHRVICQVWNLNPQHRTGSVAIHFTSSRCFRGRPPLRPFRRAALAFAGEVRPLPRRAKAAAWGFFGVGLITPTLYLSSPSESH